jgi:hypothetical protein
MVLTSLPIPRREDLASIQSWLERPTMGNWSLLGQDSDTWGSISNPESHAPDLFTFRARHDADPFSEWVARRFIVWFHNWIGHRFHKICDPDTGVIYYDDEKLLRLTYFVTTVSASLIPIISVIALYYVKTMSARLSLVTVFMFLFAANLTYFASAKRIDVFVATAAYVSMSPLLQGGGHWLTKSVALLQSKLSLWAQTHRTAATHDRVIKGQEDKLSLPSGLTINDDRRNDLYFPNFSWRIDRIS